MSEGRFDQRVVENAESSVRSERLFGQSVLICDFLKVMMERKIKQK